MTPARRRRLTKTLLIMALALTAGVIGRFLFLEQSLPSLLLGRKPGAAARGTALIKTTAVSTNSTAPSTLTTTPPESTAQDPLKLKFDVFTTWIYDEKKPQIPANVKELDGKLIEISGFMMPINETQNITKFILVNSLWGCCFGQAPAVNHVIIVTMDPGKAVDFYPDAVKVTGKFYVGETREEGYLVSVFRMNGSKVAVR
jgi:hypothetical protein